MSLEALTSLIRAYDDQHKGQPSPPAVIDTIAYAYQRICEGEDPWTALGDFSNAWYGYAKNTRSDLIKAPLTIPEQVTEHTHQWGAFSAASVEYLCNLYHLPCPNWTQAPDYILDTPWYHTIRKNDLEGQKQLKKVTPLPFAKRNIFCGNRLYQNKYEMYEWIKEAIANGLTNVHEIHDYARQKELSLYGA